MARGIRCEQEGRDSLGDAAKIQAQHVLDRSYPYHVLAEWRWNRLPVQRFWMPGPARLPGTNGAPGGTGASRPAGFARSAGTHGPHRPARRNRPWRSAGAPGRTWPGWSARDAGGVGSHRPSGEDSICATNTTVTNKRLSASRIGTIRLQQSHGLPPERGYVFGRCFCSRRCRIS